MKTKRIFETLDDMNVHDTTNNTKFVEVSNICIATDKVKQGGKISMGVPEQSMWDVINGKKIPLLILVDKEEYDKWKEIKE